MFHSDLLEQQQTLPSTYRCGQGSIRKMGDRDRKVHCTETLSQTWYNQRLGLDALNFVVKLNAIKARNLKNIEYFGTIDPRVIFDVGAVRRT